MVLNGVSKRIVDIKHSRNQAFYDYWHSLPCEGVLPHRDSFKPEDIPALLPNMLIYELVSPDFIKIRLVGSAIEDFYGFRHTGTNYLDMVEDHRKAKASQALWSQAETPCGMHILLEQELASGRVAYLETIGLPIINDKGSSPLIILQSNEIVRENQKFAPEEGLLKYIRVAKRSYFDLGAGISDFKD